MEGNAALLGVDLVEFFSIFAGVVVFFLAAAFATKKIKALEERHLKPSFETAVRILPWALGGFLLLLVVCGLLRSPIAAALPPLAAQYGQVPVALAFFAVLLALLHFGLALESKCRAENKLKEKKAKGVRR